MDKKELEAEIRNWLYIVNCQEDDLANSKDRLEGVKQQYFELTGECW